MLSKGPFRLKMEINAVSGMPLYHILIKDRRVHIISFIQDSYYRGRAKDITTLFPFMIDEKVIWYLLRAFPALWHHNSTILKDGLIYILNDKEEIEGRLRLLDKGMECDFPTKGLKMRFLSIERLKEGILYAKDIDIISTEGKGKALIHLKKIGFNPTLPTGIFKISIPPDFREVPIDALSSNT